MTAWEYFACIQVWNDMNAGDAKPEPMSNEEHDDMLRRHGYLH